MKRLFDVTVSASALVGLSPLLVGITFLELVYHGWPPVFTQVRPGKNGTLFTIYKFRSMTDERGPDGKLLDDDRRLTAFGKVLRMSSLDELPELWNVLVGEMSLVGPRPLLVQYLHRYSPEQRRRHEVRPGITGWAQVHGRNAVSWKRRFELDVWYVDNWTLAVDLLVLAKTVGTVLGRRGISAAGEATMTEFMGNANEE